MIPPVVLTCRFVQYILYPPAMISPAAVAEEGRLGWETLTTFQLLIVIVEPCAPIGCITKMIRVAKSRALITRATLCIFNSESFM